LHITAKNNLIKMSDSDSQKVNEYINSLSDGLKETVNFLRTVFLSTDPEISERIKWNSPSFYYTGEMKMFEAKEYKRDLAVINLHKGKILIVFPTGNKIDRKTGLAGKDYNDGRKIVEIEDLEDARDKASILSKGIKSWLNQIDK